MEQPYVTGGVLAGLAVVAAAGVWLALRSRALRAALTPYVGEQPARWGVGLAWFGYAVSALNALGSVYSAFPPGFVSQEPPPPVLAFLYGSLFYPVLTFANSVVSVLHVAALAVAGVLLYRHLRPDPA